MEKKLAFLGPHGTFSEEAARALTAGQRFQHLPYPSIIDVISAVAEGKVDYGVVPIENTIEGTVNSALDWLIHEVDLPILAELALPISQHLLIARREEPLQLSSIQRILSHPHAIAQCHNFIREHLPQATIEYTNSTAKAAQIVSEHPEEAWAAIGTRLNPEIYPLSFAAQEIQDYSNNYTRFLLIGTEPLDMPLCPKEKTTILVTMPEDFPGALYQVLAAFAWRKINLSKIESRPTKKGLGSYYFVIDIEQKMDDVLLPGAFAEIEALGCQVRQLGTYPSYLYKTT
ncbi:prephenate dehydratase [Brevibacillus composti]|uniref:Prephenate dehydratase n=1 Tax=Brevibacillus composti TaxID=2796470 RepID=A0A7T5EIM9_9BACL|nr:prephenate dehydratase [Brevibacillus composti]QQE73278.1 prephenate dehydratase [Brevibacillus composti]QUO40359.1 prephenate dehydratase [Brevibacillus composti]